MSGSKEQGTAVASAEEASRSWLQSFALRWLALYLLFYNVDWLVQLLPGLTWIGQASAQLWDGIVLWVASHLLGLTEPIVAGPSGSSDKTADYIQVACMITLALVSAAAWALFDRTKKRDRLIYEVMRVGVRYVLAASMLLYGFDKVFHLQMPSLGYDRLDETYGDSSPMGLLWTFMGYSASYSFFAGAAEVCGGLLVLFRRTTTLGALVIAAIMLNIEMLNLSYDVPVKLFAANLLFMAVVLLAPDLKRLSDFFVLNHPTRPVDLSRNWPKRWMGGAALVVKTLVIIWLLSSTIQRDVVAMARFGQPQVAPRDTSRYLLLSRGFHWISEYPYDR
jgi:uncharacterized membrane protein YphA (DoxX/SURF4 family)